MNAYLREAVSTTPQPDAPTKPTLLEEIRARDLVLRVTVPKNPRHQVGLHLAGPQGTHPDHATLGRYRRGARGLLLAIALERLGVSTPPPSGMIPITRGRPQPTDPVRAHSSALDGEVLLVPAGASVPAGTDVPALRREDLEDLLREQPDDLPAWLAKRVPPEPAPEPEPADKEQETMQDIASGKDPALAGIQNWPTPTGKGGAV